MEATVAVDTIETYQYKNNRFIENRMPQRLDEDQLLEGGRLKTPVDVSMHNKNFKLYEHCFSGFDQLLDYLRHSSEAKTPFRERFDVDVVTNVMTLDQFAKFKYYPNDAGGEFYAVRLFNTIFLNMREKNDKRKVDEWVSDVVKNLKFLLTLRDNGRPRDVFDKNVEENRTFAVFKTTLTSGDQKIVVGYQALIDAVDKNDDFVKFRVRPRSKTVKTNVKYLGNFFTARLSNIHFTITGNWVKDHLSAKKKRTSQDWLIATYDKDLTSEMPEKCSQREEYAGWTEESVMGGVFDMLNRVKTLLDGNGKSVFMKLAKDGAVTIDENPTPYAILTDPILHHFTD